MGEVLTVRRRGEGKQLEEEEEEGEEGERRNLREVEMEMGGLLCLADLQYQAGQIQRCKLSFLVFWMNILQK